jgi:hypothetical protein
MKKHILTAILAMAAVHAHSTAARAGGCPGACNGNGTCLPDNTCACFVGFAGSACEMCAPDYYNYPTCTFCEATLTCSGNGTCSPVGGCICNVGYSGANCENGPPPVPAVSEWGLSILALTGLIAGTMLFAQRRRQAA